MCWQKGITGFLGSRPSNFSWSLNWVKRSISASQFWKFKFENALQNLNATIAEDALSKSDNQSTDNRSSQSSSNTNADKNSVQESI